VLGSHIRRHEHGFTYPAFPFFTGSYSGRILTSGAPAKTGSKPKPKNSQSATAFKPLLVCPLVLHEFYLKRVKQKNVSKGKKWRRFCNFILPKLQICMNQKLFLKGVFYLHFTCTHAKNSIKSMERVKGIEPSSQPWEGHILPLNHTRVCYQWFLSNLDAGGNCFVI
jgi:hypothetical protein